MEALKKFTDHLYGRKILEILANQELLLKADEVVLPGNLVDEIFLKVIEEFQKKDQGQFLSSLIIAKYPLYDVSSTYLSFDLRSIIAEECHRKSNLGQIFDGIDEKTWKKVEYQLIKAQLKYIDGKSLFENFHTMEEEFLTKASPERASPLSEMKNLLENIIEYIPEVFVQGKKMTEQVIIHLKVMCDMEKFIQRYYPELFSNNFKQSVKFQQLQSFDCFIGRIAIQLKNESQKCAKNIRTP
ncbi:hypothetical protein PTTG_11887 [Puccinia triticina 1-1 BBBD Race 1]|uniref:Uncharacterized protein n=1 Tax=Puccinia triticina (isolate 1-1 / race 1 (BBBD)) TaxID=630390 RepID=A0A180GBS2_PUCT1|nr:hypothetical protein PTTG_11887 [Puccinia triticina 1-1 BBBD Race 1]